MYKYLPTIKDRQLVGFMASAYTKAALSYAARRKTGALLLAPGSDGNMRTLSTGYNGTPPGEDNCCESPDKTLTLDNVVHAEANALRNLTAGRSLLKLSIMVCTMEPCVDCAAAIIDCGISQVVYCEQYRTHEGLELLAKAGVEITRIEPAEVRSHMLTAMECVEHALAAPYTGEPDTHSNG